MYLPCLFMALCVVEIGGISNSKVMLHVLVGIFTPCGNGTIWSRDQLSLYVRISNSLVVVLFIVEIVTPWTEGYIIP